MSSTPQVLLLPARTRAVDGKSFYYIFSVSQVAEVLLHTAIQPVPFAPRQVQGIATWCGLVLPVLSLEHYLGLELHVDQIPSRDVVVRSVTQNNAGHPQEHFAICRVGAAIRQMALPLDCAPGKIPAGIIDASCLTAVYHLQASILLVVNLEKMINA